MEVDLRDQALALISDAQTADKKDKDVYLRQVTHEAIHTSDTQTMHADMDDKGFVIYIILSPFVIY